MYDGFSDTDKYKWVQVTKEFLKLSFAGGRREASCLCSRCENRRILLEYEMPAHLSKKGIYVELPYVTTTRGVAACGSQ
jgi:hypothetical protein